MRCARAGLGFGLMSSFKLMATVQPLYGDREPPQPVVWCFSGRSDRDTAFTTLKACLQQRVWIEAPAAQVTPPVVQPLPVVAAANASMGSAAAGLAPASTLCPTELRRDDDGISVTLNSAYQRNDEGLGGSQLAQFSQMPTKAAFTYDFSLEQRVVERAM
eukprot:COSAG01_NODE_8438_length_2784_cov_35.279330_3_plen_160_part_00